MGALARWLESMEVELFRQAQLGRVPMARPGSAARTIASCDWTELDTLLRVGPPDVLVVAGGEHLSVAPPQSLAELQQLFARGIGVAIREPERHSPPLKELSRDFATDLPGDQRIIVFATPGQSCGFGWHYDAEDVFIVQTAGDKEYLFRRNTVTGPVGRRVRDDFALHRSETSPLLSCRLWPGDWLYLPRGYWHAAYAHSDALSISIGVFPELRRPEHVSGSRAT
jgi:50S ribosomal protein L16 3-hydroxylase